MNRQAIYCDNCTDRSGSNNGAWKGGKYYNKKGYRLVVCADHPRVQGKAAKYVFEHILVMEEFLGRYLIEGENVHHKNGIKDDNRIENLELWNKVQPAGQRVEDKVQHAIEILSLYAPDLLVEARGFASPVLMIQSNG